MVLLRLIQHKNVITLLAFASIGVFITLPKALGVFFLIPVVYMLFKVRPIPNDRILLLPIVFFVLCLFGLVLGELNKEFFYVFDKHLGFLFIPSIYFFYNRYLNEKKIWLILRVFVFLIILFSIICNVTAIFNILSTGSFKVLGEFERQYYYFYYIPYTSAVGIDPIYLSVYANFSFGVLLFDTTFNKNLKILLLANILIFIILIGAKIGVIGCISICVIYFIFNVHRKWIAYLLSGIVLACSAFIIWRLPFLKERFISSVRFDFDEAYSGNWNSYNQRLAIWNCAWDAIVENPLGYGSGQGQVALEAIYRKKAYIRGYEDHNNAHNQFMQYTLDWGPLGFFSILAILIIPIFFRKQAPFYPIRVVFLLIIFTAFLIESVFSRQMGVYFFAFFYPLLLTRTSYE